jgi:RsiW-degrading membrane proteinase PrsW (M82 family)
LATVVTLATANANLLPMIILVGGFLLPVTFLTWAYQREDQGEITPDILIRAFLLGGILGTVSAATLEAYFLSPSPLLYGGVALLEEAAKVAIVVHLAGALVQRTLRDGLVLGAAVGFGFAACESVGYGLNAVFTVTGLSLREVVETELLRGVIAPTSHALWTAIIGAVLLPAMRGRASPKVGPELVLTFVGVSVLHALWDATHNVAVVFTLLVTDTPWQTRLFGLGYLPRPTEAQVHLFTAAQFVGYVLIGATGLFWLGVLRRRLDRLHRLAALVEPADSLLTQGPEYA